MAPRKSTESDKDKNNDDYSSENEADVSNSNNEDEGGSENEPIKKSKANGKEPSVDKNGEDDGDDDDDDGNDETGDADEEKDENENGNDDDDEADEEEDDEADDEEAPIKKRKTARKATKPVKKKTTIKTSSKKNNKKAPAKKTVVVAEEENGEEEYEVKEVIDSKKEKNVLYYLIRWKGYTAADDTWERATDLSCDDLITAFHNKNKNKKSAPAATAKQPPKKRKKIEENVDPEKEYEVEKIISMLENKKGKVFRIRWKGYRPTQDTWEPEENLNCKDLIEKFLLKHKEQSQYSAKDLREEPKRTKRLVNETKNPKARTSKRASVKVRKTYYSEDDDSE